MTPEQDRLLRQTYEMALENNRMLHATRRNAFLGSIIKGVFYLLIVVIIPLWAYQTYLAPILQSAQQTLGEVQSANEKAQAGIGGAQNALEGIKSSLSGFGL